MYGTIILSQQIEKKAEKAMALITKPEECPLKSGHYQAGRTGGSDKGNWHHRGTLWWRGLFWPEQGPREHGHTFW